MSKSLASRPKRLRLHVRRRGGARVAEGSAFELVARESAAFVAGAGAANDRSAHEILCQCGCLERRRGMLSHPPCQTSLHRSSGRLLRTALRRLAGLLRRLALRHLLRALALRGFADGLA